ncbi:hypothetical protein QBC38DRAFT_52239 [Podospora fimiseda]|uniref:Uncharacterized protein n=1 Tax=Podospora fimiseda TaxID=252190 RepID=A0AAN7GNW1_9PEZI|nr:hypothetical protein QBC38DRAFT_52239 [Podospora fimiseda]
MITVESPRDCIPKITSRPTRVRSNPNNQDLGQIRQLNSSHLTIPTIINPDKRNCPATPTPTHPQCLRFLEPSTTSTTSTTTNHNSHHMQAQERRIVKSTLHNSIAVYIWFLREGSTLALAVTPAKRSQIVGGSHPPSPVRWELIGHTIPLRYIFMKLEDPIFLFLLLYAFLLHGIYIHPIYYMPLSSARSTGRGQHNSRPGL